VRNVSLWFAMTITVVDTVTFVAAMPSSSRQGPDNWRRGSRCLQASPSGS